MKIQQNTKLFFHFSMFSIKKKFLFKHFKETVKMSKYFILSKGFTEFKEKYCFLCIDDNKTNMDRFLYSLSRFPSEVVENMLYLVINSKNWSNFKQGDVYNSNNQRQLIDLNIKTLIDFIDYQNSKETIVPSFKKEKFLYINIRNIKKNIMEYNFFSD